MCCLSVVSICVFMQHPHNVVTVVKFSRLMLMRTGPKKNRDRGVARNYRQGVHVSTSSRFYTFITDKSHTKNVMYFLWFGVVVSALAPINEINLRRARLVLRWATVSGFSSRSQTSISVCNQPYPPYTNSAFHPSGVNK